MASRIRMLRSLANAMNSAPRFRGNASVNGARTTPSSSGTARRPHCTSSTAQAEQDGFRSTHRLRLLRTPPRLNASCLSTCARAALSSAELHVYSWDEYDDT